MFLPVTRLHFHMAATDGKWQDEMPVEASWMKVMMSPVSEAAVFPASVWTQLSPPWPALNQPSAMCSWRLEPNSQQKKKEEIGTKWTASQHLRWQYRFLEIYREETEKKHLMGGEGERARELRREQTIWQSNSGFRKHQRKDNQFISFRLETVSVSAAKPQFELLESTQVISGHVKHTVCIRLEGLVFQTSCYYYSRICMYFFKW